MPEVMTEAEAPERLHTLAAKFAKSIDPDAAIDVSCYLSTDAVDNDDEVMLPGGCDLGRFEKNGPLVISHDYTGKFYPLPVGQVLWVKRRPNGLLGGVRFAQSSEMGREVKALVEEGVLRGVSVGFRPIEGSPMSRDEAASRPDWQKAYDRTKGRVYVHRKWQLLELSVTPVNCNEDALFQLMKTKGMARPAWIAPSRAPEPTMPETKSEPAEGQVLAVYFDHDGVDAKAEWDEAAKAFVGTATVEGEPVTFTGTDGESCKAAFVAAVATVKAVTAEDDPEDSGDEDDAGPVRRGGFVKVTKGPQRGAFGKVKSVHRSGLVPDVEDDVPATKADPAVRVCCYKAMGDGHVETAHHVGCKMAHCEATDDLKPPKKKKGIDPVALPPLTGRTDGDLAAEQLSSLRKALPEQMRRLNDKALGAV